MNYRDRIIIDIARRECKRVSAKAIRALQKMKRGMQSGTDTPLRNVWDEICVQVQEEESVIWSTYKDTAEEIIAREVEHLDIPTKKAMWLLTDEYVDWDENEADDPEEVPWSVRDIARHILREYLLPTAEGWHNRRIARYLEASETFDAW